MPLCETCFALKERFTFPVKSSHKTIAKLNTSAFRSYGLCSITWTTIENIYVCISISIKNSPYFWFESKQKTHRKVHNAFYLRSHPTICASLCCHHSRLCLHSCYSKICNFHYLQPVTQFFSLSFGPPANCRSVTPMTGWSFLMFWKYCHSTSFSSIRRLAAFRSRCMMLFWWR